MRKIYFPKFNPDLTLLGGQSFNWVKDGEFYYGVFKDRILKVKYESNYLYWESSKLAHNNDPKHKYIQEAEKKFIECLFDVELDYESVLCEITKDSALVEPVKSFEGLRILRQPFEQTLVSFVISQNSNIPKIKNSLNRLSELAGRKVIFDSREFYLFPSLQDIGTFSHKQLRSTGIGYRAVYLEKISKELAHIVNIFEDKKGKSGSGSESCSINRNGTSITYREKLLSLHGIGDKVADCILTFGLGIRSITPIDLWARRAFVKTYNLDSKIKYNDIQEFLQSRFGENTAYAGQFLFEYFRLGKIKD